MACGSGGGGGGGGGCHRVPSEQWVQVNVPARTEGLWPLHSHSSVAFVSSLKHEAFKPKQVQTIGG